MSANGKNGLNGHAAKPPAKAFSNTQLRVQEGRTQDVLKRFYADSRWQPVENRTPLNVLLDGEAERENGGQLALDEWGCRHEVLNALLDYLCEDGVHPGAVLRRIFAVGKALNRAPWALLTCEETGLMFGETRAAASWRGKKIYTGYLARRGFRGCKSPYQKSEAAVENYAEAAKGNQNRRGGHVSKRAKRSKPKPKKP